MMKSDSIAKASFLERYEFIIPLLLFALFLVFTLPGISWGAPSIWHPDEVVYIAIHALQGQTEFDSSNFNHPHLPIYMMLGLGKILIALGQTEKEVLIGARVLSAVLVGFTIVLSYLIPRRMRYNAAVAGLSGLLLLSISVMSQYGRFAHNDTFVTFFTTLTIFLLIQYKTRDHRGWLYAAFFASGLAISSKYSAISLAIVPGILYLWAMRNVLLKQSLRVLETLFVGGALTFLGYAAGTPKALLWMAFYFKRLIPALAYNANYGRQPDSIRGIIGQYAVFADGIGILMFLLFIAAFLWGCFKVIQAYQAKSKAETYRTILLFSILVIDLPIMLSYNFPVRFFLPLMPLFAILSALFINDMYRLAGQNGNSLFPTLVAGGVTIIILFSCARVISVMLLFLNDSRIPASAFLTSLPTGTSLEHTLYSPTIPSEHFEREHNYPIYFIKTIGGQVPASRKYEYNTGETGLDDRMTDYLVVDNFTADRFYDPYICGSMPAECDFFKQLETGRSDHYRLITEFTYTLPPYLPQINIDFVNPEIRIYERIQ
jgi:4-amino-4-deoxy-L-arabinose transferase-like glycosyltransferase